MACTRVGGCSTAAWSWQLPPLAPGATSAGPAGTQSPPTQRAAGDMKAATSTSSASQALPGRGRGVEVGRAKRFTIVYLGRLRQRRARTIHRLTPV